MDYCRHEQLPSGAQGAEAWEPGRVGGENGERPTTRGRPREIKQDHWGVCPVGWQQWPQWQQTICWNLHSVCHSKTA